MVRAITSNWKQPVCYDFEQPVAIDILFEIIRCIENAGFKVISITSDMGSENRALLRALNISPKNVYFNNPFVDNKRSIFVFVDALHLLKLARNHFISKGFTLIDGEIAKKD